MSKVVSIFSGLSAFKIGTPTANGAMPETMVKAADVYGGGISFTGGEPSKTEHFVEGDTFPKYVQLKPGEKKATGKIWMSDLDDFATLIGGTATATGAVGKLVSSATYTGIVKAVSFETKPVVAGGTPSELQLPKARIFVGENFVLNDENVWVGDLFIYPMSAWTLDNVTIEV